MTDGRTQAVEYQKTVTVDGEDYKVHLLPPSRAYKLATKLTKMIGEPLGTMAGSMGDEAKSATALPMAIKALTTNLADDDSLVLIKALMETVTFENKPLNFESHFQGRLGLMLKLVAKVVEVQFADFMGAVVEMVKDAIAAVKA
jgi:hypothetical protein